MTLLQERRQMIRKMRKQSLAMIQTHYDMAIDMEEAVDIFPQLHTNKLELQTLP